MKPITPQQIVHQRLLSTLPVRTHVKTYKAPGGNAHYVTPVASVKRKKRIRALAKEGKSPKEIARMENCTIMTVYNHLRKR